MTYNIMMSGVGGQGLMLVSNILGLTCAENGLDIRTAETHGLAQRSGAIYTHIRIGDKIFSPLIPYGEADVLMGMETIETLRYIEFLKPAGTIILNNYLWYPVQSTFERVDNPETSYVSFDVILTQLKKVTTNIHIINALELANKAGNPLTSNVVLLGALTKVKGFPVKIDQIKRVISNAVPKKALEANLIALQLGFEAI